MLFCYQFVYFLHILFFLYLIVFYHRLIVIAFFSMFGVLGVQLFAGKLYYCSATDDLSEDQITSEVYTKEQCLAKGGEWINQKYNFDHLGQALVTLYVLSSIDGWVDIMYSGVDAVGVDRQPQVNANQGMILYFVSFLLIGGFFIINMFVGVIVENFKRAQTLSEEAEDKLRREREEAEEAEREAPHARSEF